MGGGSSNTSKAALVGKSARPIRIWQFNTSRLIVAHVPVQGGRVLEAGDLILGVAFPAAKNPAGLRKRAGCAGTFSHAISYERHRLVWWIGVRGDADRSRKLDDPGSCRRPGADRCRNAGGGQRQPRTACSSRADASPCRGLCGFCCDTGGSYRSVQAEPKLAYVNRPRDYVTASGTHVSEGPIDLVARTFSMGKLHHAMTGTGTVAMAAAAAVPGTIVSAITGVRNILRVGHASESVLAGSDAVNDGSRRSILTSFRRSARVLMDGSVFVPA